MDATNLDLAPYVAEAAKRQQAGDNYLSDVAAGKDPLLDIDFDLPWPYVKVQQLEEADE